MKTRSELEPLTDDELNKLLAGMIGVQPELVDWMAYKDDGDTGSCCMSGQTEREVQEWLDKLPAGSWAKDYKPKPFYRWPDYCRCLNLCHDVIPKLDYDQCDLFDDNLCDIAKRANDEAENPMPWRAAVTNATARQRTIALILTLQKP